VEISVYPSNLDALGGGDRIKKLDNGEFKPLLVIPRKKITNNSLRPTPQCPQRGDAQAWQANLTVLRTGLSEKCWVLRRIGSGIARRLELISENHLRTSLELKDGDEVTVTMLEG